MLIFIVFLGFTIFSWISRYIKNENSPIVATKAQLVDRKSDLHTSTDANGAMSTSETHYLIFQLDTGSQIELVVNGRIYQNVPELEWGTLTFQGTRFIKFESNSIIVER
jgi:hypothetical protein